MSANGPHTVEEAALTQQVEAASRECAALSAALARSRRSRLILMLVLVVVVLAVSWAFIGLYRKVTGETFMNELTTKAQDRFQKNSDRYQRELQTLYEHAAPKLQEAFQEQMNKDMPKYAHTMEEQREEFLNTLKKQLEEKLQAQYKQLLEQQQKTLASEFKDIDPDKQKLMMENIHRAVDKLVRKYYVDELESQFRQLYATWDAFPAAETLKVGDLYAAHLEMLRYKLAHTEGLAIR